jgi:hypothetical protein
LLSEVFGAHHASPGRLRGGYGGAYAPRPRRERTSRRPWAGIVLNVRLSKIPSDKTHVRYSAIACAVAAGRIPGWRRGLKFAPVTGQYDAA